MFSKQIKLELLKKMRFLNIFFILILSVSIFGQSTVSSNELTKSEIDALFTSSLKDGLKIKYPIYQVREYNDKLGKHLIILTEKKTACEKMQECFSSIQAFCFRVEDGSYIQEWAFRDFILPNGNEVSEEFSISFWTKYLKLEDFDGDRIIDPIITYGTFGLNGTDDGRVKILTYYLGKKRAIRHQNGVLDSERNTQVDEQFYNLPAGIQSRVKTIMENITKNNHGIFPAGWKKAMQNKKLRFDEN